MTEPQAARPQTSPPWIQVRLILFFVTIELASHQMLWVQWWNSAEYFHLFIADGVAMQSSQSLHGQKSYNLKHVVLDHVTDRPGGIVKMPPPLDAEPFSHRDLHIPTMS
jgi:hypothetical protein